MFEILSLQTLMHHSGSLRDSSIWPRLRFQGHQNHISTFLNIWQLKNTRLHSSLELTLLSSNYYNTYYEVCFSTGVSQAMKLCHYNQSSISAVIQRYWSCPKILEVTYFLSCVASSAFTGRTNQVWTRPEITILRELSLVSLQIY